MKKLFMWVCGVSGLAVSNLCAADLINQSYVSNLAANLNVAFEDVQYTGIGGANPSHGTKLRTNGTALYRLTPSLNFQIDGNFYESYWDYNQRTWNIGGAIFSRFETGGLFGLGSVYGLTAAFGKSEMRMPTGFLYNSVEQRRAAFIGETYANIIGKPLTISGRLGLYDADGFHVYNGADIRIPYGSFGLTIYPQNNVAMSASYELSRLDFRAAGENWYTNGLMQTASIKLEYGLDKTFNLPVSVFSSLKYFNQTECCQANAAHSTHIMFGVNYYFNSGSDLLSHHRKGPIENPLTPYDDLGYL